MKRNSGTGLANNYKQMKEGGREMKVITGLKVIKETPRAFLVEGEFEKVGVIQESWIPKSAVLDRAHGYWLFKWFKKGWHGWVGNSIELPIVVGDDGEPCNLLPLVPHLDKLDDAKRLWSFRQVKAGKPWPEKVNIKDIKEVMKEL